MFIAKLRDMGLYTPSASLPLPQFESDLLDLKILDVAVGSNLLDQEQSVRRVMLAAMFSSMQLFHVSVPLSGFHGFDFAINGDKDDLENMAERGWMAARDTLSKIPGAVRHLLPIRALSEIRSEGRKPGGDVANISRSARAGRLDS